MLIHGVLLPQQSERRERTVTDLNVVMENGDLQNLSSFLSG